jgi:acyl carrier protein
MSKQEQIHEIFLDILEVEESDIKPSASLINDLGASSVDLVEVIAALENEFDIDISEEDAEEIRTVQHVYDFVEKNATS